MTTKKLTKLLALYLPYLLLGLAATNFGEAWRLSEGKELGDKIMSMMGTISVAFANPLPSLHPLDLLVGLCCGAGLRLAVYLRGKNAKKYRHGMEYGSARWGTPKDIEPFMAPKFEDNIILTKTERLMMSNRPPDPKNARNKNVLVVGGSGSGKTRFWLKPNLLQCHSSYVVTDPKSTILLECGNAMLKNGYKVRILNTINFKKSMHYNPFAYVHSEKDILKLVTTLMTNTKGEGSGGDPFWEKSERLLLTALIAYLHCRRCAGKRNRVHPQRRHRSEKGRTVLQSAFRRCACSAGQYRKDGRRYQCPAASCGSASSGCRLEAQRHDPAQRSHYPAGQHEQGSQGVQLRYRGHVRFVPLPDP